MASTKNLIIGFAAVTSCVTIASILASDNPHDKSFWIRLQWNKLKCLLGESKALTWEQELTGWDKLAESESHDIPECAPELEDMLEEVKKEEGAVVRRPRRHMRMPYVYRLVRHVRGEIGQRVYSQANIMVVERHARAEALAHGVRPHDLASILPHVVSMYFNSRDCHQLQAQVDANSSAWVQSVRAATRGYRGVYGPAVGVAAG